MKNKRKNKIPRRSFIQSAGLALAGISAGLCTVPETAVASLPDRVSSRIAAGFMISDDVHFHPGHAWVRVEGEDVVTVGMSDFAMVHT